MTEEELRARWPDNAIARLWYGCKYRNKRPPGKRGRPKKSGGAADMPKQKYFTEEERKAGQRAAWQRQNAKRVAANHAAGRFPIRYNTEEERQAAKKAQRKRQYEKRRARQQAERAAYWAEHPEEYAAQQARELERKRAQLDKAREKQMQNAQERRAAGPKPSQRPIPEAAHRAGATPEARKEADRQLRAARANLPDNGTWFLDWCKARGMDEYEAQERSGLPWETFGILWHGGKTVPSLALLVGHNLGMTPEECSHLGVIMDRGSWEAWSMEGLDEKPKEWWSLDWWNQVEAFNPKSCTRLFDKKPEPKPEPKPAAPEEREKYTPHRQLVKRRRQPRICVNCGREFVPENRGSRAKNCSQECCVRWIQKCRNETIRKKREAAGAST